MANTKQKYRTLRNVLISIFCMLMFFLVAGVVYVYFTGKKPYEPPKPAKAVVSQEAQPFPKPKKPAANSREGVAVESILSPVASGSNTAITVRTLATSKCTITAVYNGVASRDSGLSPKTADDYGTVTWTWTVDRTAPVGTWPVTVTCVFNGRSGVVIGNLEVTK